MIDIHTHITPDVDDGAIDMEMSLEMLRSEAAQGCKTVFLTPHSDAFEWDGSENVKYMYEQMKRVQKEAVREGIPVQVFQGCEIYTSRRYIEGILHDLKDGRLPSMNQTKYVMAEFSVSRELNEENSSLASHSRYAYSDCLRRRGKYRGADGCSCCCGGSTCGGNACRRCPREGRAGAAAGRVRICGSGVRSANVEQGRITGT